MREETQLLFDPDQWKGQKEDLKIENYRLTEEELKTYAIVATQIRKNFASSADEVAKNDGQKEEEEEKKDVDLQQTLRRSYQKMPKA